MCDPLSMIVAATSVVGMSSASSQRAAMRRQQKKNEANAQAERRKADLKTRAQRRDSFSTQRRTMANTMATDTAGISPRSFFAPG